MSASTRSNAKNSSVSRGATTCPGFLRGLHAARRAGLDPIEINAVIERGVNDDEILDLVEFARSNHYILRFIEFMDVGNANNWRSDKTVTKAEILEVISKQLPLKEAGREGGNAPSVDYRFHDDAGSIGVIASVSEPFCGGCTRARITADGKLVTCLFSDQAAISRPASRRRLRSRHA